MGRPVSRSGDEPGSAGARPSAAELVLFGVLGTGALQREPRPLLPHPPAGLHRRDVEQQFRLQRAVGRRGGGGAGAGGHLDHLSLGRLRPLQQRLEEVRTRARGAGALRGREAAARLLSVPQEPPCRPRCGGWLGAVTRAGAGLVWGRLGTSRAAPVVFKLWWGKRKPVGELRFHFPNRWLNELMWAGHRSLNFELLVNLRSTESDLEKVTYLKVTRVFGEGVESGPAAYLDSAM